MPAWAGTWAGGRYYLDAGRPVFFIERRRGGVRYSLRLAVRELEAARAELALFDRDPVAYANPKPVETQGPGPVYITEDRINLYLDSIHAAVKDHRSARRNYLLDWGDLRLDLRTVDRRTLRTALATFTGGHAGRTEALNAFARFLVREGDLPAWNPLRNTRPPKQTRAERVAYTLEELEAKYRTLKGPVRDVFLIRVATGLHHTEISQLSGATIQTGPLPDRGACIRTLGDGHEIQGVLQVRQKTKPRHRVSVTGQVLAAALRLAKKDGKKSVIPSRVTVWKQFDPIVPSNLRHTYTTLAGEVGEWVTYTGAGVDLDRVAQTLGHRVGSGMTGARYDKLQIPPMIRLPLGGWD